MNFPYASTGISTRGEVIRKEPDLVRRYMMAQVEAIARMKRDRPFTISVMSKFLRTNDMEQLSEAYDIYANKYLLRAPLPTIEAIRPVLDELEPRNPKAKGQDPGSFLTTASCASCKPTDLSKDSTVKNWRTMTQRIFVIFFLAHWRCSPRFPRKNAG